MQSLLRGAARPDAWSCRAAACRVAWGLAALAGAARAGAQGVRVEVRAAEGDGPVPHALVGLRPERSPSAADARSALSSAGLVAEGATGASGRRTLAVAPGRYRVEVRRIGQRPFVGPLVTVAGADTAAVLVRVPRAPVALAAVEARARSACGTPAAPDVIALWEAARTALAASAEARAQTAGLRAVAYARTLDTAGARVEERRTEFRADSGDGRVFRTADAATLEARGFVLGTLDDGADFHAPDERVLLSEAFARTHCFLPARGGGPERRWLGVGFTPAPRRRAPEVSGVVWLDSATAEPRRVDFEYVWRDLPSEARGVGGEMEFARLPSGAVAVRAWRIRVPRVQRAVGGGVRLSGYIDYGGAVDPPRDAAAAPRVRVAGVVYDSLVGAPLAGALVTRAGAPGVAVSDSLGRFALDSVEAGPGAFVFSHAGLDSAGLSDVAVPSDLTGARDSARVALVTPSRTTVWTRTCADAPGPARSADGVLAGVVRDAASGAPVPGGVATVVWTTVDTVQRRVVPRPRTRALRADSLGAFRVCGVPAGVELEVQGAADGSASGWALVTVGARGLATVDLLVPPPAAAPAAGAPGAAAGRLTATTVAEGVVRDTLGAPRAGARVTMDGVPGVEAVTDAEGRFRLAGVPAGTQTLVVRAVGYVPEAVSVGLRAGGGAPVEVTLRRVVQLAGVGVRGRGGAPRAFLDELESRRRLGLVTLMDTVLLRRSGQLRTALSSVPFAMVRAGQFASDWAVLFTSVGNMGGGVCVANVFVDGQVVTWQVAQDLSPDQILAAEVYRRPGTLPARYAAMVTTAAANCGSVLLWTRAPE